MAEQGDRIVLIDPTRIALLERIARAALSWRRAARQGRAGPGRAGLGSARQGMAGRGDLALERSILTWQRQRLPRIA